MFIGHFGLAFAAKKANSKPALGTAFLAAQFIDLLWPFFLLFGVEKVAIAPGNTAFTPLNFVSYPFSHSLVAVIIWALVFGVVHYGFNKHRASAVLLAVLVVSHWFLDLVVHRPDLPLSFSEQTKLGFGLWNHKRLTILVEVILFSLGVFLYATSTSARNKKGTYAFWSLVLFFVLIYLMSAFGDPPPNVHAIGYVGMAQWIFVWWGYWVDRNRTALSKVQ